ncbi:hypothetical protein [Nocardiopsis algeriensis]|uniref:Uncharacterized protein n=1 Tax=Nocardiopsis algeriensis TaxID=1478215 RepID=A0A841IT27_9ACTN|nr:hypothetical protein [Nocardiopsis algeriensis]MBB6121312.1 hypothetical protein [Nocardiopsis algeriensis]
MARTTGPGTRARDLWAPLIAAGAVVALLLAAWPLIGALLPGLQQVRAGEPITVGGRGDYRASLSLPQEGWLLDTDTSRAGRIYRFHRGPVELTLLPVAPVSTPASDLMAMWEGMRRIARAGDHTARLDDPEVISTEEGVEGLSGNFHSRTEQGAAVVYPSPDGVFAVEMTLAGEHATTADLTAVADVLQSVSFTREEAR